MPFNYRTLAAIKSVLTCDGLPSHGGMEEVVTVADTSRNIGEGGRNFQHVCLRCPLRYANLSNIMLGISN